MTKVKKNVTNSAVRDNLADWIKEGVEFSTPYRWCGNGYTCFPFYGCSISGKLWKGTPNKHTYVVYSYKTAIMHVDLEKTGNGNYRATGAEFDDRRYSACTNIMQGACVSALRELFPGLPYIPDVIGKRGGRHPRRNYMVVVSSFLTGNEWRVLNRETGELVLLNKDGDTYNGDTEGNY